VPSIFTKRQAVILAGALLMVVGCGSSGGGVQTAQKNVSTQAQVQPASGSVASASANQLLIWRVAAAAKAAAAGPHGDIGEAAVATAP
jgi:hypothetical protein